MAPHTRQVTDPADNSTPGASSGGAAGLRDSGINTAPAASVRQMAGTVRQKPGCHERGPSTAPRTAGPSGGRAATAAIVIPTALGRSASLNLADTTATESGSTIPAPRPITARAAISSPAE